MKPFVFLLFCSLITSRTFSQEYTGEASLPGIERDGFYRVMITPGISTYVNLECTNLRIFDQQDKEVPYVFQKEIPSYYTQTFKAYEIVEKKQQKNCCTSLMLRNPDSHPINNIHLLIKNAEVTKQASLLGSDDRENWFALKERFVLTAISNPDKTSEIKIVDFPLSNYSYYLLQIEDSTSAPLNILSAGYYQVSTEDGTYTEIQTVRMKTTEQAKQKQTHITLMFDSAQLIDKLTITMSGPRYFLRRASLHKKIVTINKRKEKIYSYEWLRDFEISSKQPSSLELPGIQESELVIRIENEDNPSLTVASVKAYQLNRYLVCWLTNENQYKLKFGKPDRAAPSYDLTFFRDSIPDQLNVLMPGEVMLLDTIRVKESFTVFTNRYIIWAAIILIIGVLGVMSVRMIRESKANQS